jgi:hypothetical protein
LPGHGDCAINKGEWALEAEARKRACSSVDRATDSGSVFRDFDVYLKIWEN